MSKSDKFKGTFGTSEKTVVFEYKNKSNQVLTLRNRKKLHLLKGLKLLNCYQKTGSQDTGILKALGISIILVATGVLGFVRRFTFKQGK